MVDTRDGLSSGACARGRVTFLPPPASRRSPTPTMPASAIAQAPPRPSAAARRASTRRMSRASYLSTSPRAASSAAPALVTPSGARLASRADPAPDHRSFRERVLSSLPEGKLAYVPGGVAQTRNGVEGNARFRQEPNFLYLTGITEPGYHALFGTGADAPYVLVAPRQPPEMDVWCGAQMSRDELRACHGADIVYYDDEWDKALAAVDALEGQTVFVPTHQKEGEAARAAPLPHDRDGLFEGLRPEHTALTDALAKHRAIKTEAEMACLRFANAVSGEAHVAAWRHCAANGGDVFEFEVEATFAAETARAGLRHLGYPTIAGAGRNAATLHYERNDARVSPEDLVLVDAGAEHRGYTADITRTFPSGGTFDAMRRDVYEAVLDVQNASIKEMIPNTNYRLVQELAKTRTAQRLIDLGLVRGRAEDAAFAGVASLFMPHALGHLLGLQVHDVGPDGPVPETLVPGHVVTCEPGIYFVDGLLGPAFEDPRVAEFLNRDAIEKFTRVGGVRIEDNVAVTPDGYENLTTCPKTVQEIEEIMAEAAGR